MTYSGTRESQRRSSSTQRWEPVRLRSFLERWGWVLPFTSWNFLSWWRIGPLFCDFFVLYQSWMRLKNFIYLSLLQAGQYSFLCLFQCFTIERLGRRPLMIGGFFFMGLCCFGITITVLFQVGPRLTPCSSWLKFFWRMRWCRNQNFRKKDQCGLKKQSLNKGQQPLIKW